MEFVKSYLPYKLEMVGTENSRAWRTDPITVNAYNYFSDNSISISTILIPQTKSIICVSFFFNTDVPMAILSFPVYNLGLE